MLPRFDSLRFSRYRAFRDEQSLTLGRLNLVYGKNNVGKSALLRLPQLVAISKTLGEPGLTLSGPPQGATFRDVQWRGALPSEEDPDLVLGLSIRNGEEWAWTLRWNDLRAVATLHKARIGAREVQATSDFDGLLPPRTAELDASREALSRALSGVVWLGARRDAPERGGMPRAAPSARIRHSAAAGRQVAADADLREAVSRWFISNAGVRIELEALGADLERLVLQPRGARFSVHFSDAGEGLRSAFSVVAALEELRCKGGLLCVEEPESHLHPGLERALADLMVDVLAEQPGACVMLETHSEVFLLSALKAALEQLPPHEVCIHWIDADQSGAARVEPIELDRHGRPSSDRLEQAFATMGAMRRDLLLARKSHGG